MHGHRCRVGLSCYNLTWVSLQVIVELDGGVIVQERNKGNGHDLLICDHKQTASSSAVLDVAQRLMKLRYAWVTNQVH